jgi:hypothetical protein
VGDAPRARDRGFKADCLIQSEYRGTPVLWARQDGPWCMMLALRRRRGWRVRRITRGEDDLPFQGTSRRIRPLLCSAEASHRLANDRLRPIRLLASCSTSRGSATRPGIPARYRYATNISERVSRALTRRGTAHIARPLSALSRAPRRQPEPRARRATTGRAHRPHGPTTIEDHPPHGL